MEEPTASFVLRFDKASRLLIIECAGEWDDPRETAPLKKHSIWQHFEDECRKYAGTLSGVIFDLTRVSHVGSTATQALLRICKHLKRTQPEITFKLVFVVLKYPRRVLEKQLKIHIVCGGIYADSIEEAMQIIQEGNSPPDD